MSSYFHSASQSCPILSTKSHNSIMALVSTNYTFRRILRLFVYLESMAQVWINLHRQASVVKGDPSPMWLRKYQEEDEEEAVIRAIKESEILVSEIFYNFFVFIFSQLLYFIIFFHTIFTPTTHDLCHDICMRIDFRSCAVMPKFAQKIALI